MKHNGNAIVFSDPNLKVVNETGEIVRRYPVAEEGYLVVPGDAEFEIWIPSFREGEDVIPALAVRFHWSDRNVISSKHIFGS